MLALAKTAYGKPTRWAAPGVIGIPGLVVVGQAQQAAGSKWSAQRC